MTRTNFAAAIMLSALSLLLAACGGGDTTKADEDAIRETNKKWMELIVAKDAKAVSELYAEDGEMLPPNAPKAKGREALQKGWEEMFKIPDVNLTFETERFVFAKSGDLAVEVGTYKFAGAGMTDTGKAVVTWTKKDGKWQVLTDMFSSDAPPPAPTATVPADSGVVPGPAETGPAPTTPPATTAPAPATPAPTNP
jgi:uncharacterized protein (TIGR02246 family)